MTTTVVPYIETQLLIELILDAYQVQYGLTIDPASITFTLITPRQGYQTGVELTSTSTGDDLAIRIYINYVFVGNAELSEFKPEQLENTNQTTTPIDNRFVCLANLPRNDYPILSTAVFVAPPPAPPSGPNTIGLDPGNVYNVNSGVTFSGNVLITRGSQNTNLASVNYETQDLTAIAGYDYAASSGTITWNSGDSTPKTIDINTGDNYYYYWHPEIGAQVNFNTLTLNNSSDGLTFNLNNTNAAGITTPPASFTTFIAIPEIIIPASPFSGPVYNTNQVYHEFEITTLNNQTSVTFEVDVEVLNYTTPSLTTFSITAQYNPSINGYQFTFSNPNVGSSIPIQLPSVIASLPFRIGLSFDTLGNVKANINGNWLNSGNPVTTSSLGNDLITPPSYFGGFESASLDLIFNNNPNYSPSNSTSFEMIGQIGSNQINAGLVGGTSPSPNQFGTSGGTFKLLLTDPVNGNLGTSQATVNIVGSNICYTNIIENHSEVGFLSDPTGKTSLTPYLNGISSKLDWNNATSCGEISDTRLTAKNFPVVVNGQPVLVNGQFLSPDYSQLVVTEITIDDFPIPPLTDDVRELILSAWPVNQRFLPNPTAGATGLPVTHLTNYQPFTVTGNVDGSYTLRAYWRSYLPAGRAYPVYVLIDPSNNDVLGSQPRLLQPNIGYNVTGGSNVTLALFDQYSTPAEYNISGVVSYVTDNNGNSTDSYTPNRTLYYTLDGTTPTTSSPVYDPNNPPTLTAGQNYYIQAFSAAPGWISSSIQSVSINVNAVSKVNFNQNYFTASSMLTNSVDTRGIYNFNTDSLYLGYDNVIITIHEPTGINLPSPFTTVIHYSVDGGITFQPFAVGINLPNAWKNPSNNAGFPTLLWYINDNEGNGCQGISQGFNYYYPNWNLQWDIAVTPAGSKGYQINNSITVDNTAITQGYLTTVNVDVNNIQKNLTLLNDYRYFEFEITTITDPSNTLLCIVNGITLHRNGDIVDGTGTTTASAVPAWNQGDTIGVQFNYYDSTTRFNINNGTWTSYLPGNGVIDIRFQFSQVAGYTTLSQLTFEYNFTQAQLKYSLPDTNTLPLDSTNYQAVDPYFNNVVLLLHGNGTDGSQTFTDSSQYNHTASIIGDPKISASVSPFGGGSMMFDGVSGITFADAPELRLVGLDHWTIEFFIQPGTPSQPTAPSYRQNILGKATGDNYSYDIVLNGATYYQPGYIRPQSGADLFTSGQALSTSEFLHVAFTLDYVGGQHVLYAHINGIFVFAYNDYQIGNVAALTDSGYLQVLGCLSDGTNGLFGYLAEVRITAGISRYSNTSFTPPATKFPNVGPPSPPNLVSELRFLGANGSTTFTDDFPSVVWTAQGTASIVTDSSTTAGVSGSFTGESSNPVDNTVGRITTPVGTTFNVNGQTAIWCDEAFVKFNQLPGPYQAMIVGQWTNDGQSSLDLRRYILTGMDVNESSIGESDRVGLSLSIIDQNNNLVAGASSSNVVQIQNWVHVAVYKPAAVPGIYIALNGVVTNSLPNSYVGGTEGTAIHSLGGCAYGGGACLNGSMQGYRHWNGYSPYGVSNFTPPTPPFPQA